MVLGIAGFLWSLAAVISGLPNVLCDKSETNLCGYFWLMLAGRVLSGVGEAAIAVLAVPYMDDNVDPKKKGFYMSIYFMSLPVGTALGFVWAGAITTATNGQWQCVSSTALSLPFPPHVYFSCSFVLPACFWVFMLTVVGMQVGILGRSASHDPAGHHGAIYSESPED
jgi:MFS family permease